MADEVRKAKPGGDADPERLAHFRILGRIGRGGMGIVYRAEDEKLQRTVALKVLPPAFEEDRDRRARFLREARAAAGVTHPNIATVHEIGESDGRVFIAMEYVEGRTLRAMLGGGPLPIASAVRIATQIARGLGKAHQAHVVHRDLKPDNIIVGEDQHAKILDFGLAKVTSPTQTDTPSAIEHGETATREGMLLGTPQYMSPEQARGRPIDATSDVFSFGIVLYEMVTGRRPFEGISVAEVIIAIDRDTPTRASDVNPQVPEGLERVIERCLEKDPTRRYPDGRAIADQLASLPLETPAPRTPSAVRPAPQAIAATPPPPSLVTPAPANMPLQPARKRRWWPLVVGLVLLASFRATRCSGGKGGSATVPPQVASAVGAAAAALKKGGVHLACPPLVASGVEEPSGWLGAAAANVTCRRAAILMGGRLEHVLVPAELLDLPHQPTDDFPRDPYGAAGARERAIAAAKTRAAAWLDGSVEKRDDGFHVKLIVRDPDGDEDEHAEGTGHHVYLAVREAMQKLVKEDAIDKAEEIDPEIARWTGIKDVDLALEVDDWHSSLASSPVSTKAELSKLSARRAELGALWAHIQWESQLPMLAQIEQFDPVVLDRSSPAAFAISAVSYADTVAGADHAALAAEAAKLRDAEPSPVGRRALLLAQADILVAAGQLPQAVELTLGELREEPRSDHTWEVPTTLQGQPNFGLLARAFAAWIPEDHASWNFIATNDNGLKDTAARVPFARRAYAISPDFPPWGDTLGKQLIQIGRPEEARSIATTMLNVGPFMDPAAQSILVLVDASEAHFGAAVRRGVVALDRLDRFGMQLGDWYLIDALLAASSVAQNGTAMGDDFASRFALVDPPRIDHGAFFGGPLVLAASDACILASRDLARRCFVRLRQLLAAHYFPAAEPTAGAYIDGCDRYAQSDMRGATAAWRPLIAGHAADAGFAGNAIARFGPVAFDAAGEHDLAAKIDAQSLATGFDVFGGASPAHAREARRALARGDKDRARELAQKVVDAWGAADVPVPAVTEMRGLLGRVK